MPLDQNPYQTVTRFNIGPKSDNFACLHTHQDQNELHLKRLFFFLAKSASSVSRSQAHLAKQKRIGYTTIFVQRKDKTNYLSNQTWDVTIHEISTSWKKKLDGGPMTKLTRQLIVLETRNYRRYYRKLLILPIVGLLDSVKSSIVPIVLSIVANHRIRYIIRPIDTDNFSKTSVSKNL